MNPMTELLRQYAVESGELPVVEPVQATVAEVIAEHATSEVPGENVPEKLDHAAKAEYIADQLDELADRAEELADEDKTYAEKVVSVESMHREFGTIMVANQLELKAASFESAMSDEARITGLAADARRTAKLMRGLSNDLSDFSSEGKILQFIRRDATRLAEAVSSLNSAKRGFQNASEKIKEGAVVIKHDGIRRFMTQDNKELNGGIEHAVQADVAWVEAANRTCDEIYQVLMSGVTKLGSGQVQAPSLPNVSHIATNGYSLLGSHAVTAETNESGFHVPKFKYLTAGVHHGKSVGRVIVEGAAQGVVGHLVGVVGAMAGSLVLGGVGIGAGYLAATTAYHANMSAQREHGSDKQSAAGYKELIAAADKVLSLDHVIKFKIDDDAFDRACKEAEAGIGKLEDAEKVKAAKELLKQYKANFANLARLVDVVYEHAYYLTTGTGQLLEVVTNRYAK